MNTQTPFNEFNLNPNLLNSLNAIGFENASPVQELTIEPVLKGEDIFAQAETGSGKTGSFAIPILEQILRDQELVDNPKRKVAYVVLSPTRELALQTHKVFEQIGGPLNITAASLIGGESIEKQKDILKEHPYVLVATPGRLVDLIRQKSVDLQETRAVVFDEADRLFDMGFKKDIEFILGKMPKDRQLIMVSATSNMDVLNTAYRFHSHPKELRLNADSLLVDNIDHSIAMISGDEKMPLLVNMLRDHEDAYALIFCNTQYMTHVVAEWLKLMDFKAKAISGRLPQNKRNRLIEEFRAKKVTILVCTDVAARGLDIKDVNFVVNYEIPQDAANYVHRIGRTGRAGANGQAVSFCAHEDCEHLDAIYELIESKIPKLDLEDSSFAKDIPKRPWIDSKTLKVVDRDQRNNKKNDRNRKSTKEFDDTPVEYPPYKLMDHHSFVKNESDEDTRLFVTTTTDLQAAHKNALGYFRVNDYGLLIWEVLKEGPKKFFFFGPRKTTYRYKLKTNFKKLLLPFVLEMLKTSRLDLYVKISYDKKSSTLKVDFSGKDERLLTRNNNELLYAFEQFISVYLFRKLHKPGKYKLLVTGPKPPKGRGKDFKNDSRRDSNRGPRRGNDRGMERGRDRGRERRPHNPIDEKALTKKADVLVEKVVNGEGPMTLDPMNSAERRIIHQHLGEHGKVKTTSLGDGRLKSIEISLK